jgi:ribosomal protein L11 methyltransferase
MASYFVLKLTAQSAVLEDLPHEIARAFPKAFLGASESLPLRSPVDLHEAVPSWADHQIKTESLECYFANLEDIHEVTAWMESKYPSVQFKVSSEVDQDWNAVWRSHFKGCFVEPCWEIVPVWEERQTQGRQGAMVIRMNPSLGFGTGEHPTTQLCLSRIGQWSDLRGASVLDFGSGSGILAVAAALRGAHCLGVEIDEMALECSKELAELNRVSERCSFEKILPRDVEPYDFVVANILRATLLEFVDELVQRVKPQGRLLMSGLLEDQVEEVAEIYSKRWIQKFGRLPEMEVRALDQWRSIEFRS